MQQMKIYHARAIPGSHSSHGQRRLRTFLFGWAASGWLIEATTLRSLPSGTNPLAMAPPYGGLASNSNRRRFPVLAREARRSASVELPDLDRTLGTSRCFYTTSAACDTLSRHTPPPWDASRLLSESRSLGDMTDPWAAAEVEADRQRRGPLSQVRHAALHKSTHVDLAPAATRGRLQRGDGTFDEYGRRRYPVFKPSNQSQAKKDITLQGTIVSGNARTEFDGLKIANFEWHLDQQRRWLDGDIAPPSLKPTDIQNPVTLFSADLPTLLYEKAYVRERSRLATEAFDSSYAERTRSLRSFTEIDSNNKSRKSPKAAGKGTAIPRVVGQVDQRRNV